MDLIQMSPELTKRVLTGVIGAAILLGLILSGGWLGVFLLITAISLGMVFEFSKITFTLPDQVEKRYLLLSMAWFIDLINLLARQAEFHLLIVSFIILFSYFLVSARRHTDPQLAQHFKELMYSVFALVYLVLMPLYFSRIYELSNGSDWAVVFLAMVWAGDSGAYFAGKKYGQKKLYPQISPKKTIEGAMGGLIASYLATGLYKALFFRAMPWAAVAFMPLLVGVVSQIGDLCESFFKRAFEKKDSGSILPGHGGFLDRFDGVVFSLPVMYACVRLFG